MSIGTTSKYSFFALAFAVSLALATLVLFPGTGSAFEATPGDAPSPAPTIQSDQDDYPPVGTVVITGSNWQPGETVNINVNDDEGQTWNRNVDVVADENGSVRDEFELPSWFVAKYTVTATGSSGGVAKITFLDASLPSRGCDLPGSPGGPILVDTTVDEFNNNANANGSCSLREAIAAANGDAAPDTITLPAGLYLLTRAGANENGNTAGDLDIVQPLTVNGSGARTTSINGNGADRVLQVTSSGSLNLSNATVTNGQINTGGGGGIRSDGGPGMVLTNVTVSNNSATNGNDGGGIYSTRPLTINQATISGNSAIGSGAEGGGLVSTGESKNLTNVTITNNSAATNGGGFRTEGGTTTFTNVTVSDNSAPIASNIRRDSGTLSLRNTIVSDGDGSDNCSGTIGNTSNNLDDGSSCNFTTTNGSRSNANASLGALANNGGPTDTRVLLGGSAAMNAGTNTGCPDTDQRGQTRPRTVANPCDIGAYEIQNTAPATTAPAYTPESPKTNDALQVSTTASDADGNNVSVTWVWKATRGANTCQIKTDTSAAAAPGVRASSLDLGQSYTTSNCTGASPPASINPGKGDTVTVEATPNDGTVNGTMQSNSVVIANSAPACDTASLQTDEDTNVSANPNCADADGDALSHTIVAQGTKGTASVTAGGLLQFTPNANANGGDSFIYKASDGAADSNTTTVNVAINAVNDAPSFTIGADQTVGEDAGAQSKTGFLTGVSAGPFETQTVTFDATNDNNPLFSAQPQISPSGTLTYKPADNANGSATVTVKAADDGGTANGGQSESAAQTVEITVSPVNDAPTADDDSAMTDEDTATDIPVLNGDSDVDGDALSVSSFTRPDHGSVSQNPDGTLEYTPDANYHGDDSFTYKASDGVLESNNATVSVSVKPVNDGPVARNQSVETDEDTSKQITLEGADVDGDDLTYAVVNGPSHGTISGSGTNRTYSPDSNYHGGDSFTFKVSDGVLESGTATVGITVRAINDAPDADARGPYTVDEGGSVPLDGSGNDVDGDTPTYDWDLDNDNSFETSGKSPNFSAAGIDGPATRTVTLRVSDGNGGTDTSGATVNVNNVAPTATFYRPDEVNEGGDIVLSLDDPQDPASADTFEYAFDCGNGYGAWGSQNSATCPTTDDGTRQVGARIRDDDGGVSEYTHAVTIKNVAPSVELSGPNTANEGDTKTYTYTVSDPGDDTFSVAATYPKCGTDGTLVSGSETTNTSGGSFQCSFPDGPATTNVAIKVQDSDGASDTASEAVQIVAVANVNPRVTAPADQGADEGDSTSFDLGSFTDPGPDNPWTVDVDWGDGSTHGSDSRPATGSLGTMNHTYADGPATRTVKITVTDKNGGVGTASFQVTVRNVAPTVTLDQDNDLSADEGSTHTYDYTISDPGDDTVASVATSCGANGSKVDGSDTHTNTTGSFECAFPDGPASSTVSAQAADSDGDAGNTDTQSVAIKNVAPSITNLQGPANVDEDDNGSETYTFTASDPGNDQLTINAACGDNGEKLSQTGSSVTCRFSDGPNDSTVSVSATDDDNATGDAATQNVTISNVAPATTLSANNVLTANEGQTKSYAYTVTDPGDDTVASVNTSCDAPDSVKVSDTAGSFECHFPDGPATANISAQATDSDGDTGNKAEQSVVVANVKPSVVLRGDATANEGDTKTYTYTVTDPGQDTYTVDENCGANGVKTNTPDADSFDCRFPDGPATTDVTVKVTDSDGAVDTDNQVVTVTVSNVAPSITAPANQNSDEGENKSFNFGSFTDPGPDSPWAVDVDWGDGSGHTNFDETAAGQISAKSHTFGDNGAYTVTVKVTDRNGASDTETFTINVSNVAPTAVDDPAAVAEGGTVTLNVLDNDTDPGDDTLSLTGKTNGQHGEVECAPSGSCAYTPDDPDFFGSDSFTYTVGDEDGGTDEGKVNVEVYAVNDAPKGSDDAKSTPENTPLVFPSGDLVGNDDEGAANEGNQTLTVTRVGMAEHGQVSLNGGQITFTPDADYNGAASFKYTVCDDGTTNGAPDPKCEELTAVVNVTINPVNSRPEATDGTANLDEDAPPISIDLGALVSDKETSDANLTYNIVQGPTAAQGELTGSGPIFTLDSARDYFGGFDILYTVTDRGDPDDCSANPCDAPKTSEQKKVTVTVNPVNDAPVAEDDQAATNEDEQATGNVLDNDSDVDDARANLTTTKVDGPAHGTANLNANGSFTYTPNPNYNGPDSFTYKVRDGSLVSNTATVNITVKPVNDAPKINAANGPLDVNEGDTKNYSVSASDIEGDNLTYKWTVISGPALVSGSDTQSSANVEFRDNGPVSVQVEVSDGNGGKDAKTFSVTVANVAPRITNVTSASQNVLAGTANNLLFTGTATDPSSADTNAGFSWNWALNGQYTGFAGGPSAYTFRTSFTGCGPQTVSAKAADKDGGVSNPFTTSPVNVYNGAYKAPLVDGSVNKVQKGQVVPVKISVGCGTSNLTGLSPHIQLLNGNVSPETEAGTQAVTTSVSSADSGQFMRPADGGYIYNLRVPSDSAATAGKQYTIRVNPFGDSANNAASGMYVVIEIRK